MAKQSKAALGLKALRERTPLSVRDVAKALGKPPSTYSFYEDGFKGPSLPVEMVKDLEPILVGKGEPPIKSEELWRLAGITGPIPKLVALNTSARSDALRNVEIVGIVQAGVWREAVELPIEDRRMLPLPIPATFEGMPVQAFDVRGPSMDEIYPHGTVIVGVKFLDLGRSPRSGERVVAVRSNDQGMWESTCKEFRIDRDGKPRLWPRSTHPNFQQPIVLEPDPEETLEVVWLVIMSVRPEI